MCSTSCEETLFNLAESKVTLRPLPLSPLCECVYVHVCESVCVCVCRVNKSVLVCLAGGGHNTVPVLLTAGCDSKDLYRQHNYKK